MKILRSISLLFLPAALFAGMLLIVPRASSAQDMTDHEHMDHMQGMDHTAMPGQSATHIKSPEALAEDKRFSEFNHHFAGVFVLLVGLLAMIEPRIAARHRWARYLWLA